MATKTIELRVGAGSGPHVAKLEYRIGNGPWRFSCWLSKRDMLKTIPTTVQVATDK